MKKLFIFLGDKIKDFYYKIRGVLNNRVVWLLLFFAFVECITFWFFDSIGASSDIIAGSMTGLGIIFGYFITHYLELLRKKTEEKFKHYCKLLEALRVFIVEANLDEADKKKLASDFQQAYFGSTISISRGAYDKLKGFAKAYSDYQGADVANKKTALTNFVKAQSDFVNYLRKEFFCDRELDFQTYDIRWK